MPGMTSPQPPMTWHEVGIPAGMRVDGAVVELCEETDGTLIADLRIPATGP